MKIRIFQELLALDEGFVHFNHGLERMEKESTYTKGMIRRATAHVDSAQFEVNRQFFDEADVSVENDAFEAYKSLRDHKKKVTDPDIYLESRQCEEASKANELPPSLVAFSGWNSSDEKRYKNEQGEELNRAVRKTSTESKAASTEDAESASTTHGRFTNGRQKHIGAKLFLGRHITEDGF